MSLYQKMKDENHKSLKVNERLVFIIRAVPSKKNVYLGIVAQSSLLEDARKRKKDRPSIKTLDHFFIDPITAI